LRPVVVLAYAEKNDWIFCQVTSNRYADSKAVELKDDDFAEGGLPLVSYVRPGKLFTLNADLIKAQSGILKRQKLDAILDSVVKLLQANN
jgi:mRNA interferase MazF